MCTSAGELQKKRLSKSREILCTRKLLRAMHATDGSEGMLMAERVSAASLGFS